MYSGACDGELIHWDLTNSDVVKRWKAHTGFIRGICESLDGKYVFSAGDDKCINMWSLDGNKEAKSTYRSPSCITSLDHHWSKPLFVSTGETLDVWDHNRSQPINSFEWGSEMVYTAKFNPAEPCLIGATAADNSISLYDLRGQTPIRKVILAMRSNALCWNPQEPTYFTVANENSHLYTFDMRKLKHAVYVHSDHVMPVLDIDYSPNGQEFVSASYDKTVRLWKRDGLRSRDVYHTKRMQRVLCAQYSTDGRFVFSGSEDHNIRIWKSVASEKLGPLSEREKKATYYREELKKKFGACKEVSRIVRHQHVPKSLKKTTEKIRTMKNAASKKIQNVRAHSKPGAVPFESERNKMIREEQK